MTAELRTSISHPLRIFTFPVGTAGGAVGISQAPGKKQVSGHWARDLDIDLQAIVRWGATHLVSLLEPSEFHGLRIEALPERARAAGLQWHGLPVANGAAPDARLLSVWGTLGPRLVADLLAGQRVLVHCRGGNGRSGVVTAMLLLQAGTCTDGEQAIACLRTAHPEAIETRAQAAFVTAWAGLQVTSG